ncbi:MAG: AraC family transcriptional regulator [Myxococcales bacterium]|nr:AraC family transcriptional regulator [Myxococcales bacterium]
MVKSRQQAKNLEEVSFHFHGRPAALVECVPLPGLHARGTPASWERLQILRFHIWLVITVGHHQHLVDFHRVRCQAGSVLHIGPGQIHRWDWSGHRQGYALLLGPAALSDASRRLPGTALPGLDVQEWPTLLELNRDDATRIASWCEQLAELSARPDSPATRAMAWHLAMVALHDLRACDHRLGDEGALEGVSDEDLARLRRFKVLLERSFRVTRAARDYARGMELSPRTLDRLCHAATGRSAKDLIDARVTLEAQRLLAHSDASLEDLADELGFSEATNFVKFFTRRTRQTPGAFRRPFRG